MGILQCVFELFFGPKKRTNGFNSQMATVAKKQEEVKMRFNPIALATLLVCSVNGTAFALSTDSDALPELPLPVTLQGSTSVQTQLPAPANASNQNIASTPQFW